MGFLSGRKRLSTERRIIEIKSVINVLTLRIHKFETLIAQERTAAKTAVSQGRRERAKLHLKRALDFEAHCDKYYQQRLTLETSVIMIEEAQDQSSVLRAITLANEALDEARALIDTTQIQTELDRMSSTFEELEVAGDILSENITGSVMPFRQNERVEQELRALESSVLADKEGGLPSPESSVPDTPRTDSDLLIEKILDELEEPDSERPTREIQL